MTAKEELFWRIFEAGYLASLLHLHDTVEFLPHTTICDPMEPILNTTQCVRSTLMLVILFLSDSTKLFAVLLSHRISVFLVSLYLFFLPFVDMESAA
jgi:hypothetical protein